MTALNYFCQFFSCIVFSKSFLYVINDILLFFIIIKSLVSNFNDAPNVSQEKEYTFQGSHINIAEPTSPFT